MELVRNFIVNDWGLKIAFNEPENDGVFSKKEEAVIAPGAGKYEMNQLLLAIDSIKTRESLNLSVKISGENIAFLSTEIFFKDKELEYYYGPVMQEYIRVPNEKEIQGVLHPVWESEINLALEIIPTFRLLTNGEVSAFAFMRQEGYGQHEVQLEGLFTKKDSGNSNRARLKFDASGELTDKRVIQEKHGRLVSHELAIKTGDMFIPAVQVMTAQNLNNPKMHTIHGLSDTLVKLDESFHWVDEAAIPGDYLLGLVVEDFNGDQTRHFVPFKIVDDQEHEKTII